MIIGVRGKPISCNSVFLYFVFVFSSSVRSISVGARVRLSSVCGAPPPLLLRVVTDGAKAGPMANLIGLRWSSRWTHEYPFDTNYRQWAPGGGAGRAKPL